MSEKGQKSRQWRSKPAERGLTLKGIFKPRRIVGREHFPQGETRQGRRTRETPANAFQQAPEDSGPVEEEVCSGCGLEECGWLGNQGEGYVRNGQRYCCQRCAEEVQCSCQG